MRMKMEIMMGILMRRFTSMHILIYNNQTTTLIFSYLITSLVLPAWWVSTILEGVLFR
jgi:hypothetical protein